jgi:hypothetical protein
MAKDVHPIAACVIRIKLTAGFSVTMRERRTTPAVSPAAIRPRRAARVYAILERVLSEFQSETLSSKIELIK